jgi:NAD(P)-dependent dehydrogenase (short-subunit alcohol dehydrogenase family)
VVTARKREALSFLSSQYSSDRLLVLEVDVTKKQDVVAAFAKTKDVFQRLDVVFNNAGYGALGEVEGTPDDVARSVFEVNFWGNVNVTQQAVKFFREVNAPGVGGRLIQMSSASGIRAFPVVGFYAAS